jgi:hypothetical protein
MTSRVYSYIRRHHVGLVAIFIAVTGTAWAAAEIGPRDIEKNAVRAKHVMKGQIGTSDVANDSKKKALKGADIAGNSLSGADVNEATLGQVPSAQSAVSAESAGSAQSAQTANSATTAGNADTLDGLDSSAFASAGSAPLSRKLSVADPTPDDNDFGTQTLLTDGPWTLTAGCAEAHSGTNDHIAQVLLSGPANFSVAGVVASGTITPTDQPAGSGDVLVAEHDVPVGASASVGFASFTAAAPSGEVLSGSLSLEVMDAQAGPGFFCTFGATTIR